MITSSTKKGTEGCNISYSSEQKYGKLLLKSLPEGWKVRFDWSQILFSDVQYGVNKKRKEVQIVYNQNLHIWWSEVIDAVKKIVETKTTSPEIA